MISRERLPLGIGSGSPASIERAALVGGDAPGLAKRAYVTFEQARACSWRASSGPVCVGVSPSANSS
jgi:hypothetical protein